MLKRKLSSWLRKKGLLRKIDDLYYYFVRARNYRRNQSFKKLNPAVPIPDDYALFETYRLDYQHYFYDGKRTAASLLDQLREFTDINHKVILEWGCGPARIIRHLPSLAPDNQWYACDYNEETIRWCSSNIQGVHFSKNELQAPLPYTDQLFDIVYAISVFTHLSRQNHFDWMEEIYRIVKPGGLFLLTTQGESFLSKLTKSERARFDEGALVERSHMTEGHRLFSSFQPPVFMRCVFSNKWNILKHIPGSKQSGPQQDTWIIKKLHH